jgi:hypothetical protein
MRLKCNSNIKESIPLRNQLHGGINSYNYEVLKIQPLSADWQGYFFTSIGLLWCKTTVLPKKLSTILFYTFDLEPSKHKGAYLVDTDAEFKF